jgi:hypothetical protein
MPWTRSAARPPSRAFALLMEDCDFRVFRRYRAELRALGARFSARVSGWAAEKAGQAGAQWAADLAAAFARSIDENCDPLAKLHRMQDALIDVADQYCSVFDRALEGPGERCAIYASMLGQRPPAAFVSALVYVTRYVCRNPVVAQYCETEWLKQFWQHAREVVSSGSVDCLDPL